MWVIQGKLLRKDGAVYGRLVTPVERPSSMDRTIRLPVHIDWSLGLWDAQTPDVAQSGQRVKLGGRE